ncbi:MAG: hypothetical protein K0S11_694 [Gammaproteobacteria bacterium]|jgi:tetratricopeptide (TPR) repeat protein|nr:hypothetical protein [Gammaproteobacteria bacterium]
MNNKPLYNRATQKAMFFKPHGYIAALASDEYFHNRLTEFRKNLRDKSLRDSLLQDKNRHAFQTVESSTLSANTKPIETIVNSLAPKKPAKSVNPPTIQADNSSNKKKKRKKNQPIVASEPPKVLSKAKSVQTKTMLDFYEAVSEIENSREKLNMTIKRYQKILTELEKYQLSLNKNQYTELHDYLKHQIELIKIKPGHYYIQRARCNEEPLTKNNISDDNTGWNAIISDYAAGEMRLKFDIQEDAVTKKITLYRLITLYQKSQDLTKAINYCNKILNAYPEDAKAYYQRAASYALSNQFLPALADVKQALAYKINFPKDGVSYENDAQKLCLKLEAMLLEHEQNIQQLVYSDL